MHVANTRLPAATGFLTARHVVLMKQISCPICHKPFEPQQSAALPFCSDVCRNVDLGRWLDERYGFPVEPEEFAEAESAAPDDDRD